MKKKHILLIGLGAALAAAGIILWSRLKDDTEKPPRKAPQVPVDNPGDQSEFPKAASESELG